jgi:endonuclease/exonuclease/phosphatase family metal-dependent hydrolase
MSKDRTLITSFALKAAPTTVFHVINCHLSAGPEDERRLRQMHEAVESVRKGIDKLLKAKAKGKKAQEASKPCVIICGDFNSDCGSLFDYLRLGRSEADKKPKINSFGPCIDAYGESLRPTMTVAPLIGLLCDEHGTPSADLRDRLSRIFARFASGVVDGVPVMTPKDVNAFITLLNDQYRGSERECAERLMLARATHGGLEALDAKSNADELDGSHMTLEDFIGLHQEELKEGKFWSVRHGLGVAGESIEPQLQDRSPFCARYDYFFVIPGSANLTSTLDFPKTGFLPNDTHPSDHLPIGITIDW